MNRSPTWAVRVAAAIGVCALVLLVACGDDGSSSPGSTASPATASVTASSPANPVAPSAGDAGENTTTPPAECRYVDIVPVPPPTDLGIRVGHCGPGVNQVQQLLAYLGYSIGLDGQFGPATEAVVREYQASVGLQATGVVDAESFSQLDYDATP